ncbi:N-terminal glutamine amidase-domain-containing protein [Lipomyces chichibuensis]|uniref:N-terminal glutamine amidase-domain-containing protein n=1 Tax=Lipomyces chichibuensis TaxID=1546026 RepID=UPI003343792F
MELPYASCYCEENIYQACKTLQSDLKTASPDYLLFVVFISSPTRAVPLFCQRSSWREDGFVIWDYHVVLVKVLDDKSHVLDFDTTIQADNMQLNVRDGLRRVDFVQFDEYAELTFRHSWSLPENFRRRFRVISAQDFLSSFASDRSHMLVLDESGQSVYVKAPPPWPPICGPSAYTAGMLMNIDSFIGMVDHGNKLTDQNGLEAHGISFGEVLTEEQFLDRFSTSRGDVHNIGYHE